MWRAIDQNNRLDDHERRLKLIEDALEEMVHTRVHHVDLHDMDKEYVDKLKEEEFTSKLSNKKQKKNAEHSAKA